MIPGRHLRAFSASSSGHSRAIAPKSDDSRAAPAERCTGLSGFHVEALAANSSTVRMKHDLASEVDLSICVSVRKWPPINWCTFEQQQRPNFTRRLPQGRLLSPLMAVEPGQFPTPPLARWLTPASRRVVRATHQISSAHLDRLVAMLSPSSLWCGQRNQIPRPIRYDRPLDGQGAWIVRSRVPSSSRAFRSPYRHRPPVPHERDQLLSQSRMYLSA
jgi:hypothetical protein